MANNDAPRGLTPVRNLSGSPFSASSLQKCYIPSTDTDSAAYIGCVVKLTGAGSTEGHAVVTANVTSGDVLYGVVVSVVPETADSTIYRANSTSRYVMVCTDPYMLYEVQEDSTGGALAVGAIGGTCALAGFTSGSTTTGRSAIELDSSLLSETNDADDDVFIHQLVQAPDNEVGTNARWLVSLNNTVHKQSAVGV